jgi:hypothetical protein
MHKRYDQLCFGKESAKEKKTETKYLEMDERAFKTLTDYLEKIPSIVTPVATGADDDGLWWVKFK